MLPNREVVQPDEGLRVNSTARRRQDVFVHISAVERAGLSTLNEGRSFSTKWSAIAGRNLPRISK